LIHSGEAPEFTVEWRAAIFPYFGFSWLELDTVSFPRTQFWAQQGHFEGISEVFGKRLNLRKCLMEAALEVVPGGGIEPSTLGFSVP
jgi:hypothetical protein